MSTYAFVTSVYFPSKGRGQLLGGDAPRRCRTQGGLSRRTKIPRGFTALALRADHSKENRRGAAVASSAAPSNTTKTGYFWAAASLPCVWWESLSSGLMPGGSCPSSCVRACAMCTCICSCTHHTIEPPLSRLLLPVLRSRPACSPTKRTKEALSASILGDICRRPWPILGWLLCEMW